MATFHKRSVFDASPAQVWAFHARPGAFARLMPPWQAMRVDRAQGTLADTTATIRMKQGPLWLRWEARHDPAGFIDGVQFVDDQMSGPFKRWHHVHRVEPVAGANAGAALDDRIEYDLPMGWLGRVAGGWKVRADLERTFRFRHRRTAMDVAAHARWADRAPLRVVVTGSTGLIGSQLVPFLVNAGHSVDRLVRAGSGREVPGVPTRRLAWEPEAALLDAGPLDGCDAVVHLAGANVAARRWTAEYKERILRSRVGPTALLARALAGLARKPRVLVVASGASGYGRDEADHDESSPLTQTFLADVVRQWEAAAKPAIDAGIRVVFLRIGVVISARGGALPRLVTPARLLAGGPLGSGRQGLSFIAMDDLLAVIERALHDDTLAGPVNAVAPRPTTNEALSAAVAAAVGRPRIVGAPGWAVRAVAGELAEELLASNRVVPRKLVERGHHFALPEITGAVAFELGRA